VILAIDQGTTGTTCMVFSEDGKVAGLRADGGATANAWMLQFQADLLGVPVVVPEISETTARAAAYLAAAATGVWTEDDVRAMWTEAARYEPATGEGERAELPDGWRRAIETTRNNSRRAGYAFSSP
jgi:glycerol kinase